MNAPISIAAPGHHEVNPVQFSRRSSRGRWGFGFMCALTGLMLAAPVSTHAQVVYGQEMPADADLDAISSMLSLNMLMAGGGPMAFSHAETTRQLDQGLLWCLRLNADDKMTTAVMTATFQGMQRQVNSTVAASDYLADKLKSDLAFFEERNGNFRNPGFQPANKADADDLARYKEIQRRLDLIVSPTGSKEGAIGLPDAAAKVKEAFQKLRAETLGSAKVVREKSLRNAKDLAAALDVFAKAADKAEKLATSFMTIGTNAQAVASPRQQIRMDFTNESPSLVFFIRVWTQDKAAGVRDVPPVTENGKTWYLRKDGEEWQTLWPKDAKYQATATQQGQPKTANLPNTLWVPAKLQDRLELRVATYGEFRQRLRWQSIFGGQVRPDLTSLKRGFYYMSYAVNEGEKDQILSRWFSMDDNYSWQFTRGVWTDGIGRTLRGSTADERKELRALRTDNWKMTNDRLIWILPAGIGTIFADPNMSASVKGDADILHASGRNPQGESNKESGEGELSVALSVW